MNFKENKTFSDFDFIITLAYEFNAVILYEPLVFRRIHEENYIHSTWEKSMYDGIEIIEENRNRLPGKIARDSLFRLHIDFGENYLKLKRYRDAIKQFNKAWKNKPLAIVPVKKMLKTFLYYLKGG